MQSKILEMIVHYLLSLLDVTIASQALVALLRGALSALKEVAAKSQTTLDDEIVAKCAEVTEALAKVLKVA